MQWSPGLDLTLALHGVVYNHKAKGGRERERRKVYSRKGRRKEVK